MTPDKATSAAVVTANDNVPHQAGAASETPEQVEVQAAMVSPLVSNDALYEPGNEACCRRLLDEAVAADRRTFVAGSSGGPLVILRVPKQSDMPDKITWDSDLPATCLATPADIVERAETMKWMKRARNGGLYRISPPRPFCTDYGTVMRGRYSAKVLRGVARTPPIDELGSVRFPQGYDTGTGLYFDRLVDFTLHDEVTHAEAKAAAELLLAPFSAYMLADHAAGQAVLLCLMFTAVVRPFLQTAPLFVIRSSMAGAGKGLVVASAVQLALGTRPVIVTYGGNAEEFEKRLASVMLQTPAALSVDNANGMLISGDLLESLITEGFADIRPLGRSETHKIQNRALICLTGNNPVVTGDMARRTLVLDVVPRSANPESDKYSFHPVRMVMERRTELLIAAYTAMRAYRQAGMPDAGLPAVGSFEGWSREVRDLVHWLTGYDVSECFKKNRSEDPHRQNDGALLAAMHRQFGTKKFRSAEPVAIHRAVLDHQRAPYSHPRAPSAAEQAIYDAVEEVLGSKGVSAKNLGYWARRIANAHIGGYVLETQHDAASNTKLMKVTQK